MLHRYANELLYQGQVLGVDPSQNLAVAARQGPVTWVYTATRSSLSCSFQRPHLDEHRILDFTEEKHCKMSNSM